MRETTKKIRSLTMACWWPSKITGRTRPDWSGIFGELYWLFQQAKMRRATYGTSSAQEVHELAGLCNWVQGQIDDEQRECR